jgi:hypothetical protein
MSEVLDEMMRETATAADLLTRTRDVFGLPMVADPVPDDVLAGLALLEGSAPLWGDRLEWTELIVSLRAFASRWHHPSISAGWTMTQLWGLDPVAPRNRLSRMGGGWLVSLRNRQVIQVDPEAIRLVTRTSARMSIYRPEVGGVLAWEIAGG